MDAYGTTTAQSLESCDLVAAGLPRFASAIEQMPTAELTRLCNEQRIPRWHGAGDRIRSVFCTGAEAVAGTGLCQPCSHLLMDEPMYELAERTEQRMQAYRAASTAHERLKVCGNTHHGQMTPSELRIKCNALSQFRKDAAKAMQRQHARRNREQQQAVQFRLAVAARANDQPRFMRLLEQAHVEGKLHSHDALVELIEGSAAAIVHGRKHRRLNATQQAFFLTLLNYGGPLIHDTVSLALSGPHVRSTQRLRATFFQHGLGMELRHFQHAADVLSKYHAQDACCMLAEDATALQAHLEPVLEGNSVTVYGLNGLPVQVSQALA